MREIVIGTIICFLGFYATSWTPHVGLVPGTVVRVYAKHFVTVEQGGRTTECEVTAEQARAWRPGETVEEKK